MRTSLLTIAAAAAAIAILSLCRAQVLPQRMPDDTSSVHCWNGEVSSYVSCSPGFTFVLGEAPPAQLRVREPVFFTANLHVTDQFVHDHGGDISGLHLGTRRAKICRGLALLCSPKRFDGGLAHDSGAPGSLSRDGSDFTFAYAITMDNTPGDYTIMAYFQIDLMVVGLAFMRTVLPLEPNAPAFVAGHCALATPAGLSWGNISFISQAAGLQVAVTVTANPDDLIPATSVWDMHLLRYGDRTNYFAPNMPFVPQVAATASCEGKLCESGILVSNFSQSVDVATSAPFVVPSDQLDLNGVNSIIGRGVQVRESSITSNGNDDIDVVVASCVVEAVWPPPSESVAGGLTSHLPLPIPDPDSLICRFNAAVNEGIRGTVTWEASETVADADADLRVDMTLPVPTGVRGDVVLHSVPLEGSKAGEASTRVLQWRLTNNNGSIVPGALSLPTLRLDGNTWMAQASFLANSSHSDFARLVGGTLYVSASSTSNDHDTTEAYRSWQRCVIGYAGPGVEEMREGPANIAGPVPQTIAGSCAMYSLPGNTGVAEVGVKSNVRGIVHLKEFQSSLQVAFSLAGLPSFPTPTTEFFLRVHDFGFAEDPTSQSLGKQFIAFDQDARSLELQVSISSATTAAQKEGGLTNRQMAVASGRGKWEFFKMLGVHGILGRSIALVERTLLEEGESGGGASVERTLSHCVVGRAHGSERHVTVSDMPILQHASCRLRPVAQLATEETSHTTGVTGLVQFETVLSRKSTRVRYDVAGLDPDSLSIQWLVRDYGEHSVNAQLSGDVFEGKGVAATVVKSACKIETKYHDDNANTNANTDFMVSNRCTKLTDARDPQAQLRASKVGMIAGTGVLSGVALDGLATGTFFDPALTLAGFNSIVGRALVVTQTNADGNERAVAECVVGRAANTDKYDDIDTSSDSSVTLPPTTAAAFAPAQSPSSEYHPPVFVQLLLSALLLSVGMIAGASCRRNRNTLPFRNARMKRRRRRQVDWVLRDGEGDPLTTTDSTITDASTTYSDSSSFDSLPYQCNNNNSSSSGVEMTAT